MIEGFGVRLLLLPLGLERSFQFCKPLPCRRAPCVCGSLHLWQISRLNLVLDRGAVDSRTRCHGCINISRVAAYAYRCDGIGSVYFVLTVQQTLARCLHLFLTGTAFSL